MIVLSQRLIIWNQRMQSDGQKLTAGTAFPLFPGQGFDLKMKLHQAKWFCSTAYLIEQNVFQITNKILPTGES